MKTNQITVKTFYEVSLSIVEMRGLYEDYVTKEENQTKYPNAYNGFDDSNVGYEYIKKQLENGGFYFLNGSTYSYIADRLKFDGWQNLGYYNKHKECYEMTFYNRGDTLKNLI